MPSNGKKYTFRHVVAHEMKAEVRAVIEDLSGAQPGTAKYFSKYQAGLKEVCDSLPEDVKEEYTLNAKEWNEKKPPVEVQQA
jgi:hypothetical protein